MKISEEIKEIILEANCLEVSDIHFHPQEEGVKIYYRIMSKLILQTIIDKEKYDKYLRYIKFKSQLDISISKKPQDGSFHYNEQEQKIFIRVSTIPLLEGESLVIRILQDQQYQKIEEIAYYKEDLQKMIKSIQENNGLFIFTGPTGSGKTTTMYSILNHIINDNYKKIITIENPIEIINNNFTQIQINEDMGITYSSCLKASLRQDPDIIMIGEIRDEETARNVFRAALTGHTVISTMHTKDKIGVVERFKDFGFLSSEIESILIGISNQRLILNKDGKIKSFYDYALNQDIKKLILPNYKDEGIEIKIEKARNKFNEKIKVKKN